MSVLELDRSSNCQSVTFDTPSTQLECTSLSGAVNDEKIECIRDGCAGLGKALSGSFTNSLEGVASIDFSNNDEDNYLLWRSIQSPSDFTGFDLKRLILDYESGSSFIDESIVITGSGRAPL